jgi:acyl carrier protein
MNRDEAFATFQKAAVDVLSVDADKVVTEASFADDLDADSLDLVEFVMALEEQFDIEVPESDLADVKTVGAAFELVCSKLGI